MTAPDWTPTAGTHGGAISPFPRWQADHSPRVCVSKTLDPTGRWRVVAWAGKGSALAVEVTMAAESVAESDVDATAAILGAAVERACERLRAARVSP